MRKVAGGGQDNQGRLLAEPEKNPVNRPDSENFQDCFKAAVRFLGYRPRSEHEVRQRLQQRGFEGDSINAVIAELKKQGLLDDLAFAESWRDDRNAFNPRSRWLIKSELRQKRIAGDIIDQVTGAMDDEDNAYRAASIKARSLSRSDCEGFRRRLGEYLKRRGFDYGLINRVVEQVWRESNQSESAWLERTPEG